MQTDGKKDSEAKTKDNEFERCNSENFEKMFEMMSKCCPWQGKTSDFSAMMKMCSRSKTSDIKSGNVKC